MPRGRTDKPVFVRVSAVDGLDGGWTMDDTVAYAKELKARGIDVIDCSSGGLFGSATAARVKRTWGFQVPYAERVRREAGIKSMAVGLIVDPFFAEDILQKGQADLIAIAREALVNSMLAADGGDCAWAKGLRRHGRLASAIWLVAEAPRALDRADPRRRGCGTVIDRSKMHLGRARPGAPGKGGKI